jgi:prolyl-tRNA synthetase
MRWSNIFIPTLRDNPADAEVASHRLLIRAGYIRQLTSGVYSLLPLAQKVRIRIIEVIREEMKRAGAQEFYLPALHPAEIWKESGRWEVMGENMFRLRDRKGADLGLGMTHEEIFTAIARDTLVSYRQLPQIWYQIQTKFRDEARPKSGLLRVREFTMKDSYSFDYDSEGLDRSFDAHYNAYCAIFSRCGLAYVPVEASSGAMGGSQSIEFMVKTDAGEDDIVSCPSCGYAANVEKAVSDIDAVIDPEGDDLPEEVATPGVRTIQEVAAFADGVPAERQIKSLVYLLDDRFVLALVRGDHELNEVKLADTLGAVNVRPAHQEEIASVMGADAGSLGGVGVAPETHPRVAMIVADEALRGRRNMMAGANRNGFHLQNVSIDRDIAVTQWADIRGVRKGDRCSRCGGALDLFKAVEIGHIFKLGTKYSESMGALVLGPDGSRRPIIMGSYGIGVERLLASIVETSHDDAGIIWPAALAPYQVVVTPVNIKDEGMMSAATEIYTALAARGVEALLDDRDERAGVKFKDADLVGIPYRITVGRKIGEGIVELVERAGRNAAEVRREDIVAMIAERLEGERLEEEPARSPADVE